MIAELVASTFTDIEKKIPMMPPMDDAPSSLLSGSYKYILHDDDVAATAVRCGGLYGTSPRETQLHIKHMMSRGRDDPIMIALRTLASSCSRDATNGTTSST